MPKYLLLAAFILPPILSQTAAVLFAYITALLAALYVHSRQKSEILQFAWPLLILTVPLVYGLRTQEFWDWGRDIARLPKPVFALMAALLLGHVAGRRHGPDVIEKLAVLGAMASCVLYLLFGIHGRTDTQALIDFAPLWNRGGFYLWIPAMLLIVVRFMTARRLSRVQITCAALLAASVFASQSRAVALALVIGCVLALVRSRLRAVKPARLAVMGALVAALVISTIIARFDATPGIAETNEMEYTAADYGEESQHWRGFEAFQAVRTWASGSLFEQAFGRGMGTGIDLGGSFWLAGRYWETLPQSHNGYATLLVKTGVLGIGCFLIFSLSLVVIAWRAVSVADDDRMPAVLAALGAAVVAPILAFTVEGFISPGAFDPMLTFIGAVLGANTSRIHRWIPSAQTLATR